jgi:hypothetical protein
VPKKDIPVKETPQSNPVRRAETKDGIGVVSAAPDGCATIAA